MAQPTEERAATDSGLLGEVAQRCRERFAERREILSFREYFDEVLTEPLRHTRDVAHYVRDAFDHYGSYSTRGVKGEVTRHRLFDAEFNGGATRVMGQEQLQGEVYQHLSSFCERGRVDKLLLIHGPNGTAKSTFVECLMAALEDYSLQPEGILYRFNWIFSDNWDRTSLGFHEKPSQGDDRSLAHLDPDAITFKLGDELKDHPLLLIPLEDRLRVLTAAFEQAGQQPRFPHFLVHGALCAKNNEIFRALSNAYGGDWEKVVEHVQVERITISQRFRSCAVVIQPQRNVDAAARPLNLEKSYRFPPILNQSNLHELSGDLVDANRGIVEYSDFFKRPLELSKYLLTTSEKGTISLASTTAYMDCVFFATCNEKNVTLFKRNPDFPSFKGRFVLLRAPYLLRFSEEEQIYAGRLDALAQGKSVAPHVARVAALWAVLTRLRRPSPRHYTGEVKELLDRLTPLDKALLYDTGQPPIGWTDHERKELLAHLDAVAGEYDNAEEEFEGLVGAAYEGRRGVSPREVMAILHAAADDADSPCFSPLAVLKEIRRLCEDASLYEFLRLPSENGYGDVTNLADQAELDYRSIVRDEVHSSLALVEEGAYEQLFEDYFQHVKAFDAKERLVSRVTGRPEAPSEELMGRVESLMGIKEKPAEWRQNLIMRIAAWAIENPGQPVDYVHVFGDILDALRKRYFKEREVAIEALQTQLLRFGTDDWGMVDEGDQAQVLACFERLASMGYDEASAKEALVYVIRHRGED
jgi:serine protein kinase